MRSADRSRTTAAAAVVVPAAFCALLLALQAPLAQPRENPVTRTVTVVKAERILFPNTISVTGILVARKDVLVQPDREGMQITQVPVHPGDTVRSGQVLARLAPPEGQPGGSVDVTAPVEGLVTFSSAVVGALASARGPPLFQIADRGEMELLAEAPIATLQKISAAQRERSEVRARVEVIGTGELPGKIRMLSTAINPTTQLGQLRVSVIARDARLRAGAFGRAIIDLGESCEYPGVPLSAVLYLEGSPVVQVVRDDIVETREVTVGLLAGKQAEIRKGLTVGEMVIVRAGAFVRDGDRVHPIPETPETACKR
jgi:multidrug efflux pump subunit AcrA (membrane-fusion protein)